jgi:hypothetical protein
MSNIVTHRFRIRGDKKEVKNFMKFFADDIRVFNIDFNKVIPLVDGDQLKSWGAWMEYDRVGKCTFNIKKHPISHDGKLTVDFEMATKNSVPEIAFREMCVLFPNIWFESYGFEPGFAWKYLMTVEETDTERTINDVKFVYSNFTDYDLAVFMRECIPW